MCKVSQCLFLFFFLKIVAIEFASRFREKFWAMSFSSLTLIPFSKLGLSCEQLKKYKFTRCLTIFPFFPSKLWPKNLLASSMKSFEQCSFSSLIPFSKLGLSCEQLKKFQIYEVPQYFFPCFPPEWRNNVFLYMAAEKKTPKMLQLWHHKDICR